MNLNDIIDICAVDDVENVVCAVGSLLHMLVEPNNYNLLEVSHREVKARNESYYEVTVPRYTVPLFKEHFRMSPRTFEELVTLIGHSMVGNKNKLAELRKKVMFSLWILAKQESFLAAGDRFNFSKSSAYSVFVEILDVIVGLTPSLIRWPDRSKRYNEARAFQRRSRGFPGIVAAIDGCHIPIKSPQGNFVDFYNRNKIHSIILQGTCDHNARFVDVFIGMPGRMHDARVFRQSELYKKLSSSSNSLVSPHQHIIGDSAYPLLQNVMTPFRDNGLLTSQQTNYNRKLSCARSIIERAFGILKSKFRRLNYLDIKTPVMGNKLIAASCVLHNFLIDKKEINFRNEDIDSETHEGINNDVLFETIVDLPAVMKRNAIMESLL